MKITRNAKGYRTGECHGRAKLTDQQVAEIRMKNAAGVGYVRLRREYRCGESTIRDICTNRTRVAV